MSHKKRKNGGSLQTATTTTPTNDTGVAARTGATATLTNSITAETAGVTSRNPIVDVLDRLAPPILFFPDDVAEEYVKRFSNDEPQEQRPAVMEEAVEKDRKKSTNKKSSQKKKSPSNAKNESTIPVPVPVTKLQKEGFPDREVSVMRRLLAMMAGILSKASASASRSYYSRVSTGNTSGNGNGSASNNAGNQQPPSSQQHKQQRTIYVASNSPLFQQNINTSVFNLFSTLSASATESMTDASREDLQTSASTSSTTSGTMFLKPPAAFMAKDGEALHGYSQRLLRFWKQLSPAERLRLVQEEHSAMTNEWQSKQHHQHQHQTEGKRKKGSASKDSPKSASTYASTTTAIIDWCLCSHCKHRRMTVTDLTDCIYQCYLEELESYMRGGSVDGLCSGSPGSPCSSLYASGSCSPERQFLFKALSVVGEQALLPRYNRFILRLEGLYASHNQERRLKRCDGDGFDPTSLDGDLFDPSFLTKLATLQSTPGLPTSFASSTAEKGSDCWDLDPQRHRLGAPRPYDADYYLGDSDADEHNHRGRRDYLEDGDGEGDDGPWGNRQTTHSTTNNTRAGASLGVQSEDDEDLLDEETDLPIDESELMLPGGAAFPLLSSGNDTKDHDSGSGSQSSTAETWSEASRFECGRTLFLMFASEMFQYRLQAAHLIHVSRQRQLELLAEVEAEELAEREAKVKMGAAAGSAATKRKGKAAKKLAKETVVPEQLSDPEAVAEPVEPAPEIVPEPPSEPVLEPEAEPSPDPSELEPVVSPHPPIDPILSETLTDDVDEDDFDPNELINQLTQEMKTFEMHSIITNNHPSPPGFSAPPPGFTMPLEEDSSLTYPHPPFALFANRWDAEADEGLKGPENPDSKINSNPLNDFPTSRTQSRFQSFFSNSIFGPSTFFPHQ